METRYLKTFKVVLDMGSFSLAAKELCITQSAVSQRIKVLESHYGCQLIDRSAVVLKPTPPGVKVLARANMILTAVRDIEEAVNNLGKKSEFIIGFTPTFGFVFLPNVLDLFLGRNSPEINIRFISQQPEQLIQELIEKKLDVIVIEHCNEITNDNIAIFPLPKDEMVMISSPSLGITAGETRLEVFFKQRLISRGEVCSSRHLLNNNLSRTGNSVKNFRGMITHDHIKCLIQSTMQGQGVAFVSRSLVNDHISKGDLCEHIIPEFSNTRSRTLACNQSRVNDPLIKDFVESVFQTFNLKSPF
ncbi:MAG: LysR family transcriptional regulator [Geobacteraceae bacterium]|nr:LysR family transcriptional regulator [Geobacteraceae bacterium]NTW79638.1 LysR family transcriptional regulator [Geobacteraceae bacterium]